MNEKNVKLALLSVGMVIVGFGIGFMANKPKVIPTLKDGDEVIAQIDGKDFTTNELYLELKEQGGSTILRNIIDDYISDVEIKDKAEAEEYAKSVITNLKSQYEMYNMDFKQALKDAGYTEESYKQVVYKERLSTLTAEKYIKENMISDKDIKKYYESDIFGSMHVRYILVIPEKTDDMSDDEVKEAEVKAYDEAMEVIEKLNNGENFEELAKTHSDDKSTASQGGLFDGFTKDQVVEEFWNASVKLEDGKYTTEPVKSSYGYFVISRIKQDEKPSLDDVKDEILDALLQDLESDTDSNSVPTIIPKAWVKIRDNYNINIIDTELANKYEEFIKSYK